MDATAIRWVEERMGLREPEPAPAAPHVVPLAGKAAELATEVTAALAAGLGLEGHRCPRCGLRLGTDKCVGGWRPSDSRAVYEALMATGHRVVATRGRVTVFCERPDVQPVE